MKLSESGFDCLWDAGSHFCAEVFRQLRGIVVYDADDDYFFGDSGFA